MEPENNVVELNPTPVRDFFARNKTKIAVAATAVTCLVIHRVIVNENIKLREDYMEERGILNDFNDHLEAMEAYE